MTLPGNAAPANKDLSVGKFSSSKALTVDKLHELFNMDPSTLLTNQKIIPQIGNAYMVHRMYVKFIDGMKWKRRYRAHVFGTYNKLYHYRRKNKMTKQVIRSTRHPDAALIYYTLKKNRRRKWDSYLQGDNIVPQPPKPLQLPENRPESFNAGFQPMQPSMGLEDNVICKLKHLEMENADLHRQLQEIRNSIANEQPRLHYEWSKLKEEQQKLVDEMSQSKEELSRQWKKLIDERAKSSEKNPYLQENVVKMPETLLVTPGNTLIGTKQLKSSNPGNKHLDSESNCSSTKHMISIIKIKPERVSFETKNTPNITENLPLARKIEVKPNEPLGTAASKLELLAQKDSVLPKVCEPEIIYIE